MDSLQNLFEVEKELLDKNSILRDEYKKIDLSFEIARMVKEARLVKGYTQGKLADLLTTKQTGISRLERGLSLPSLSFLVKIAEVLGTYIVPPRANSMYVNCSNTVITRQVIVSDLRGVDMYYSINLAAVSSGAYRANLE